MARREYPRWTIWQLIGLAVISWLCTIIVMVLAARAAVARDDGQWSRQPPEVRKWFQQLMRPDYPEYSCCGESEAFDSEMAGEDAVTGDFKVRILNGKGIFPDGTVFAVPRRKLQTTQGNPIDNVILFVIPSSGEPICLIPKVGA
jgi:hypothetical protein